MITDWIGRPEVLLPNYSMILTKFVINKAPFKIKTQEIPRLFLLAKKKKSHLSMYDGVYCPIYSGMTRTVLWNCPIKAEIRALDNQSDLWILL